MDNQENKRKREWRTPVVTKLGKVEDLTMMPEVWGNPFGVRGASKFNGFNDGVNQDAPIQGLSS